VTDLQIREAELKQSSVEIEKSVDTKAFFDGLFDMMIEYIERHKALAALTITHEEYTDPDSEHGFNGRSTT
jgi:hypothetical protein